MDGLVATGEYERARAELEFILKYQDRKTGMIWHELSQSAGSYRLGWKIPLHVRPCGYYLSVPRRLDSVR